MPVFCLFKMLMENLFRIYWKMLWQVLFSVRMEKNEGWVAAGETFWDLSFICINWNWCSMIRTKCSAFILQDSFSWTAVFINPFSVLFLSILNLPLFGDLWVNIRSIGARRKKKYHSIAIHKFCPLFLSFVIYEFLCHANFYVGCYWWKC